MKKNQDGKKHDESNHSNKRFEEVCEMIRMNSSKFLDTEILSDSSSEEEIDDIYVLEKTCSFYGVGDYQNLRKVREYLQDSITSGAIVCLICIESVKRNDKIWNCKHCYCVLHLHCIKKWAKDTLCHLSNNMEEAKILKWSCPKCRWDYAPSEKPEKYLCFCGEVENPAFDNWRIPHSCGNTCNKKLKPDCGHFCCLLCHPGPCPPCPKTISLSCCCSKSKEINRRCSDKEWICGKVCLKKLSCNIHFCEEMCHKGNCSPCKRQSVKKCQCESSSMLRPCDDPVWQCDKICNKSLECGHHFCKLVCHSGLCPPCPNTGPRFCPCQKKSVVLPCTEKVLPCGDTCDKLLDCGLHRCSERCHYGSCEKCIQMRLLKCRCGQREKTVLCGKEFICDIKCKNRRDCGRHNCNRKCCPGNCPPCEAPCGKTLNCGNHKCSSFCHPGPCYPCKEKVEVVCNCGSTKVMVNCGRKKSAIPPKCPFNCKLPANCHHPARQKHKCHSGKCPPCNLICGKPLNCEHICQAKCHSAVLTQVEMKKKIEGPWDLINARKFELVSKPCPPCQILVSVTCLGGHESSDVPCSQARPASCGKPCGRHLLCGNHTCLLECHKVDDITDIKQSDYCESCSEACQKSRKDGCTHPCLLPCHPGECSPCKQSIKMRCHCQINIVYVNCDEWNSATEDKRACLLCCNNRCPKQMSCGHRCILQCHPGSCSDRKNCKKKVVLRCTCKRIRKEFQCFSLQCKSINIECDDICLKSQESLKALMLERTNEKEAEKLRQQEKELQDFLKKSEGKKKRKKKQVENFENTKSVLPLILGVLSILICIMSVLFFFYYE